MSTPDQAATPETTPTAATLQREWMQQRGSMKNMVDKQNQTPWWMDRKVRDVEGVTARQLQEMGFSSLQELVQVRDARQAELQKLAAFMKRPDVSGLEKHRARCEHRHKHGRLPRQCPGCWLLPGFCVCAKLPRAQPSTKVIIHVHHDEWCRGSNTGCLCAGSLTGAELLLKGYEPHDQQLQALLDDPSYTTALLWPGPEALEPQQLQQLAAERSGGRIALIAIDATWAGATKMRRRYPQDMLTLRLPPDLALPQLHEEVAKDHMVLQQGPAAGSLQDTAGCAGGAGSLPLVQGQQQQQQGPQHELQQQGQQQQQSSREPFPAPDSKRGRSRGAKHVPAPGEKVSLLRGMRKYNGSAQENGRVSTLEAVAAALLALEGDEQMYLALLQALKIKVDSYRQQKHMPSVFGTSDAGDAGDGA